MTDSLMSVMESDRSSNNPVLEKTEASSSLLFTIYSQEEFLIRDLTVQTANNQNAKQFNFYNCNDDFR